ncbi:MAG: acyl-CoA dehydrogenase family protein [bacterium]
MDFSFGEDADMVRQTAHEFVRRDLVPKEPSFINAKDPAARHAIADAATAGLKEMGMYSAGVPEKFGGGGLGPIETCCLAEELGTTIIPVEWGEPTPILYEAGPALKDGYLAPVVAGDKRYAIAFREPLPFTKPDEMRATAEPADSGWKLAGTKELNRSAFDFLLVFARAPQGPTCFVVDRDTPGATVRTEGERLLLDLKDCAVSADRVIGEPGKAIGLGREWSALARIVRAAATLGTCDRLLEVTAQYAHDWTSLGRNVSERRPIQRTLAELAADVDALRWAVYHAAWHLAQGKKAEYESLLVKMQAARVLSDGINRSVRIHGGTIPPIQQWLARARADEESGDLLRLAVARETMNRILPQ